MDVVRRALHALVATRARIATLVLGSVVASQVAFPLVAAATETEAEKKVGEVSKQVSEEGVVIILAILTALVALIALVIILPKAVKMIKRFL